MPVTLLIITTKKEFKIQGLKFAPQRIEMLKLLYEDELKRALQEDGSPSSSFISPQTYYPTN